MENIKDYVFQKFKPNSKAIDNLNKPNKSIELGVDIGDGFFHPHNTDIFMTFKIRSRDANRTYTCTPDVRLVNNFLPHLFCQHQISNHGQVLDILDYTSLT